MAVEQTYVVCARAEGDEDGTEQGGDSGCTDETGEHVDQRRPRVLMYCTYVLTSFNSDGRLLRASTLDPRLGVSLLPPRRPLRIVDKASTRQGP